jgi:hypothetical protein
VQLAAGPNSIVGNIEQTMVSDGATTGFCVSGAWEGATGFSSPNYSSCFIGNAVHGGRSGIEGLYDPYPYTYNCSGNTFFLYSGFDVQSPNGIDAPSFAAQAIHSLSVSVCGNTLLAGGYGVLYTSDNDKAIILNNDFRAASYRGIGFGFMSDTLDNAQIFGNKLREGVSFHVQVGMTNGFGWFLGNNTYMDMNSNTVPVFLDPISAPVHISN